MALPIETLPHVIPNAFDNEVGAHKDVAFLGQHCCSRVTDRQVCYHIRVKVYTSNLGEEGGIENQVRYLIKCKNDTTH